MTGTYKWWHLLTIVMLVTVIFNTEVRAAGEQAIGSVRFEDFNTYEAMPGRTFSRSFQRRAGTYVGTFILKREVSFPGFNCDGTDSFPATIQVSKVRKKVTATLNNLPISFSGGVVEKGFNTTGSITINNTRRNYKLRGRNIRRTSGKLNFIEVVQSDGQTACRFKHSAQFVRSPA